MSSILLLVWCFMPLLSFPTISANFIFLSIAMCIFVVALIQKYKYFYFYTIIETLMYFESGIVNTELIMFQNFNNVTIFLISNFFHILFFMLAITVRCVSENELFYKSMIFLSFVFFHFFSYLFLFLFLSSSEWTFLKSEFYFPFLLHHTFFGFAKCHKKLSCISINW